MNFAKSKNKNRVLTHFLGNRVLTLLGKSCFNPFWGNRVLGNRVLGNRVFTLFWGIVFFQKNLEFT